MTSPPLTEKWVPLWPVHSQYQLGDEMAYAEIVSNVTISATTEATANTIVTAPPVTFDGATPVIIDFNANYIGVGSALSVWLFQDGVSIGRIGLFIAAGLSLPGPMKVRITPTAGAHTYSIRAFQSGGNSTIYAAPMATGSGAPVSIRISRVNAVPPTVLPGPITPVTYGITLPAAPADGQEAILVDSLTAPTYAWHFRYVASITDAYKWVFIGGAPQSKYDGTDITLSAGGVYQSLAPAMAIPRAGYYLASHLSHAYAVTNVSVIASLRWQDGAGVLIPGSLATFPVSSAATNQGYPAAQNSMPLLLAVGSLYMGINGQYSDSHSRYRTTSVIPARVA